MGKNWIGTIDTQFWEENLNKEPKLKRLAFLSELLGTARPRDFDMRGKIREALAALKELYCQK